MLYILTQVVKITSHPPGLLFFSLGEKFLLMEGGLGGEAPQKNFEILAVVFTFFLEK